MVRMVQLEKQTAGEECVLPCVWLGHQVATWEGFSSQTDNAKEENNCIKTMQGVTEIFEAEESAKPNKTHGFIAGGRRQEREMWPWQMWPFSTVGSSWAYWHGHITGIPSCCYISPTSTIGILQHLHPRDVSSSPGAITHLWKGSQGPQVSWRERRDSHMHTRGGLATPVVDYGCGEAPAWD